MSSSADPLPYVWLERLLPTAVTTSIAGLVVTFIVIVGNHSGYSYRFGDEFEVFISLAWLFFLLALIVGVAVQMALTYQRDHILDAFGRGKDGYRKWRDGGMASKHFGLRMSVAFVVEVPVALVLVLLLLLAFMFLSLCVVPYCVSVGWISFTVTVLSIVLAIAVWFLQNHV